MEWFSILEIMFKRWLGSGEPFEAAEKNQIQITQMTLEHLGLCAVVIGGTFLGGTFLDVLNKWFCFDTDDRFTS